MNRSTKDENDVRQQKLQTLVSTLEAQKWMECRCEGKPGFVHYEGKALNKQVDAALMLLTRECEICNGLGWCSRHETLPNTPIGDWRGWALYNNPKSGEIDWKHLLCNGYGVLALDMTGHGDGAWRGMLMEAWKAYDSNGAPREAYAHRDPEALLDAFIQAVEKKNP